MNDKSKLSIGITDIGIAEALSRWQLGVPSNQRRYAWDEEYVEQLFYDLTKAFDAKKPIYFLGTIVLTEGRRDVREVADGQQRLATTTRRTGRLANAQPSQTLWDNLVTGGVAPREQSRRQSGW